MFFYLTLRNRTYVLTLGKRYEYLHTLSDEELTRELEALA